MTTDRKDEEMICALTADEHAALRRGLEALPDAPPPRAVWRRIRAQAEAEGLVSRRRAGRRSTWYAGAGLAAAVVLAVMITPRYAGFEQPEPTTEPQNDAPTNTLAVHALQALMVQSQRLESELRALPDAPRVMRAGTVATITDIEDRIAAIDYQLGDTGTDMSPDELEIFWRERVRLMDSLLQLRYAQAQRTAF